jgi:phosphonate transport system substrate-binding protein
MTQTNRRAMLMASLAALGSLGRWGMPDTARAAMPLRLGLTPVFLDNDALVIERLSATLRQMTGLAVQLEQRRTYQEVTGLLLEGGIDAAWLCGFPYLQHRNVLDLVAVPVWRGRPVYQSYVIVDAADPARALGDLAGGTHAFSDPDSNSGFLATVAELHALNARPEIFLARTIFTYGHRNVVRAVASGLTRSGSVDGYVWETLSVMEPALTARTRVLLKSADDGFPPFVARKDKIASPALVALKAALLRLHDTEVGRAVLASLHLDAMVEAPDGLYDGIAARMTLLERASP